MFFLSQLKNSKPKKAERTFVLSAFWLRNKDSNLDRQIQRLQCYPYTIPQYARSFFVSVFYYIPFSAFVKGFPANFLFLPLFGIIPLHHA